MKKLFIILVLCALSAANAEELSVFHYGKYAAGQKTFLFGDNVRVRSTPEIKENIVATLPVATQITILSDSGIEYESDYYKENWYKIQFNSNGKTKEGYVWGGLIAKSQAVQGEYIYLAGITKFEADNGISGEVRLISKNKILSSIPVKYHYFPVNDASIYTYSIGSQIHENKGIPVINSIFEITMLYEACGAPNGSIFIGRYGSKLVYIAATVNISEAGVFSYTEDISFPSDKNGIKNKIIIHSVSSEFNEEKNDYEVTDDKKMFYIYKDGEFIEEK